MDLRFESRPDHLLVLAAGEFDHVAAKQGLSSVIKECNVQGLSRILVDGRGITTLVSIADRFDIATQLATESQGALRMAVVVAAANMFTKTLEDAAANRGTPLRTTDSMQEAREFLQLAPE
jgi:hypothetical protein